MKYFLLFTCIGFLSACCDLCEKDIYFSDNYVVYSNVFMNGSRISNTYDSAYAIGLKDTSFKYGIMDPLSGMKDSSFKLKLNIHKDTTGFVFVDRQLFHDTVVLAYERGLKSDNYKYLVDLKNIRIVYLSNRLSTDFSRVILNSNWSTPIQLNLHRK